MKKIIAGLFAIAAFTFSAVAQDQTTDQKQWNRDGQGMHRGHDGGGMRMMQQLNLTDAQKQQMKTINEEFRTRMQSLQQNDNMLVKDQRAQRKLLMEERNRKISEILTPEQRTKFEQFRQQHEGDRGDWKKGGDWKEKRKSEDGKEKIKVKTS